MKNNPFKSADYTEKSLMDIWKIVSKIAREEFSLDFYEPYFEICTFEEMLQIYTTGFPIMFNHWSFGKAYEDLYKQYKHNKTSIAYEVIFNTNPALCYLLETNSSVMQGLVMAHAAVGHSAFFKNNEFIRENTNAKTIIPFLRGFRDFTAECEAKYGSKRVEEILDVCKSLSLYAIDRADVVNLTKQQREAKQIKRELEQEKDFDLLVAEVEAKDTEVGTVTSNRLREENILKFVAKNSPSLKQWERELILMYCKTEQYFYPLMFTKLMNEGYASFWHYTIMNRLYDLGYLNDGDMLEFLHSHTGVLTQRDHDQRGYNGINPYSLGFAMFSEIKRICTNPTDEDKFYSPNLIGKNWIEEVNFAAANFKDESFILQYLTPKLVRDFKLFKFEDNSHNPFWEIKATQDDQDFREIRTQLAEHYNIFNRVPLTYVEGTDLKGSRALYLVQKESINAQIEGNSALRVIELLKKIWPYPIKYKYQGFDGQEGKTEF